MFALLPVHVLSVQEHRVALTVIATSATATRRKISDFSWSARSERSRPGRQQASGKSRVPKPRHHGSVEARGVPVDSVSESADRKDGDLGPGTDVGRNWGRKLGRYCRKQTRKRRRHASFGYQTVRSRMASRFPPLGFRGVRLE